MSQESATLTTAKSTSRTVRRQLRGRREDIGKWKLERIVNSRGDAVLWSAATSVAAFATR